MRVLAPTPESSVSTPVADGYQLCARCGEALVIGENALAAQRLHSWLVYTHYVGPECPQKAVRGWKAVRFADTVRKLLNKEVYRQAESYRIGGSLRPCVCLLDDCHLEAELALVEYQPSDEVVTNGADLRKLLSSFQKREAGGGKRLTVAEDQENGGKDTWRFLVRNSIEKDLIAAIDGNHLTRSLDLLVECLGVQRRKSYASARTTPPVDPTPHAFVDATAVRELRVGRPRGRSSPKADHVLSRDLKGRAVELPLYSNRGVIKQEGKWISELEYWAPKPRPVELPYNSTNHPRLFLWAAESLDQLEPVDSSNPYGPVAILMRESIDRLNAQRNDPSRCENIEWEETQESEQSEEAVPVLAGSGNMARYEGPEPE